jgi:hypothetical protein
MMLIKAFCGTLFIALIVSGRLYEVWELLAINNVGRLLLIVLFYHYNELNDAHQGNFLK